MQTLPAATGWHWIKQGFGLFRKQPAEFSTLFLAYMFLMLVLNIVPVIGQMLPLILVPVFAVSFMQACLNVEQGKRVYPTLLLIGFRPPLFKRLAMLGVLYLIAAVIAVGLSSVVDGGIFWQAMTGQGGIDPEKLENANLSLAMLTAAILYIPAAMAFWYAAPLILWQDMGVGKAVFYSFFAVLRNWRPFALYAAVWIVLGIILPAVISTLIAILIGQIGMTIFILLPLSIILTVVMYCSFYPTYTVVFGKPAPDSAPLPPA